MTEAEWAGEDPEKVLAQLWDGATERKLRLLALGVLRSKFDSEPSSILVEAVLLGELLADGFADEKEVRRLADRLTFLANENIINGNLIPAALYRDCGNAMQPKERWKGRRLPLPRPLGWLEAPTLDLIREVFGYPSRSDPLASEWLAWEDGLIPGLAQTIYETRAYDRLPILGDALEDANCTNTDLLAHLRSPGPHVRGCWALDLILGKQ